MGVDSKLLNKKTKEFIDVRGFWRYSCEEMQHAIKLGKDGLCKLLSDFTKHEEYKSWIADRILKLANGHPENIIICHDDFTYEDLSDGYSWYNITSTNGYIELPDIYWFTFEKVKRPEKCAACQPPENWDEKWPFVCTQCGCSIGGIGG